MSAAESILRLDGTDAALVDLHREVIAHHEGLERYPIVYYFRRRQPRRSALYVLSMLGEASAFMRWVLPPSHPVARSPALLGLISAQRRLLGLLRRQFLDELVQADAAEARWRDATGRLSQLGIDEAPPDGGSERHRAWVEFVSELHRVMATVSADLRFDASEIGPSARDGG